MDYYAAPNKNFPGPKYNQVIQNDPQIIKINEDHMEWGARQSILGKADMKGDGNSDLKIEHVKNQG